jgi:glycosyltransferase involved in cell wall biosynthesis
MHEQTEDVCVICRLSDEAGAGETIAHVAKRAATRSPGADLALVLGDLELPDGWLERLRDAAASESTTATVCPLPGLGDSGQAPHDATLLGIATVLDVHGPSPRTQLVSGPCVFVSRAAFDLLGGMDESLTTSASAIADFGLRAWRRGLANLSTGELIVPSTPVATLTEADRVELAHRYPTLWQAAQFPASAAAERSLILSRTALRKLSVTIDARSLGTRAGGTQVYTLELIRALAATGDVHIRALIGPDAEAAAQLEGLEGTSLLTYEQALESVAETDLVHRPQQVFTVDDLDLLRPLGRRLVITHLDLIAYHNPIYFPDLAHWQRHVRATRIALAAADHVLFFSSHSLHDAEREDLVEHHRTSVVPLGVDLDPEPSGPTAAPRLLKDRTEPFLLCLGTDYTHKNRPFAIELIAALRQNFGWRGVLVLAGAHVAHGSSRAEEQHLLEGRYELGDAVIELGPISDSERGWLMKRARALVYPTVLEGFGLVPFEAAAAGIPCLFASQSSLAELLPPELATLDGWNLERSSTLAARLLTEESARGRHVEALRDASREYSWELCARRTIEAYRETLASPAISSARQAWEAMDREREIVRLDQGVQDLVASIDALHARIQTITEDFGADGLALVGPDGLLSRADQRALLALAIRPALRRPLFASARAAYRLARRGKAEP